MSEPGSTLMSSTCRAIAASTTGHGADYSRDVPGVETPFFLRHTLKVMLHMRDIVFQHEPQRDAIFSKEPTGCSTTTPNWAGRLYGSAPTAPGARRPTPCSTQVQTPADPCLYAFEDHVRSGEATGRSQPIHTDEMRPNYTFGGGGLRKRSMRRINSSISSLLRFGSPRSFTLLRMSSCSFRARSACSCIQPGPSTRLILGWLPPSLACCSISFQSLIGPTGSGVGGVTFDCANRNAGWTR
jgi:hypothetical protein